ncbi:MAG: ABC transporter permease [Thermoleophilia bacterium]|nr:ABC transporter permease [Thermoleophilia bacterium]
MNELFGIPTGALALAVAAAMAAGLGVVGVLALRNPIFVKLGLRNIPRRRGRSALIVAGLMLGTVIISAALATGDTMSKTIRSAVVTSLGETDELVSVRGVDVESVAIGEATRVAYFDEAAYRKVREAGLRSPNVDAVAPAIIETVAVQDVTTRQNEPRVTLFASDPAALRAFSPMRSGGGEVSLADLRPGELFLNEDAAEELGARPGHRVRVLAGAKPVSFRVRAVVEFRGAGTSEAAVFTDLVAAQRLLGVPGKVEHVLVSNRGDELSGAKLSDAVVEELRPVVAPLGLEIKPEKQQGLEIADVEGASIMSMFTTFGSFSIAAGILLIFLIFVMLAAERRSELGIARAIGTRRGHLVQLFLFEGVAYDLAAAIVGAALGVAVAYGMVFAIAGALTAFGVEILFAVTLQSVVLAYAIGVLLTLGVVGISAWRVSRLNIATAVRDLPEPPRRRRRGWIVAALGLAVSVLLVASGVSSAEWLPFGLGVSLALVSLASLARRLGVPDRLAFTAAGLAIVVFWLLPADAFAFLADFASGFSVFLAGGLLLVVGATWVIIYNAPLLLKALAWALSPAKSLAPVLRLAIAYPLRSLFRTGVTLAMFTLVVFTLVVGVTTAGSFNKAWADVELFGGGFDVRATAAPASPLGDVEAAVGRVPGIAAGDVRVAASQAVVPLEAKQAGAGRGFESYPVTGLDDAFLERTSYGFAAIADGYGSAPEVWRAVREGDGLAVVDPNVAPRRDNWAMNVPPDFQLSGFYLEDGRFEPVPIVVRDRRTGRDLRLTVIGVLADTIPAEMWGISTSQRTLERALGPQVAPTVYWLDLADGADAAALATKLESTFLANGLEAQAMQETLDDYVAYSRTFMLIIEAFMGLGLLVGVTALGVIAARSVVERRQQIGVLRALGFRRRMIQAAFLLESSFIALTAIVVGTALGLGIAYNVIADSAEQPSWSHLTLAVPWLSLAVIFLVVYAVALVATLAPAVRASRVYPAEALRYQ